MTATDKLRARWGRSADDREAMARFYGKIGESFGDFAVVDGELYAIERLTNFMPQAPDECLLVPPSGETAE